MHLSVLLQFAADCSIDYDLIWVLGSINLFSWNTKLHSLKYPPKMS